MSLYSIFTTQAPKPIGPYAQAIEANGFVFTSGQLGINPDTGKLVNEDLAEETEQTLKNLKAILNAAETDFSQVVTVNIYIIDLNDFGLINKIYSKYFSTHQPARTTVQVKALPLGARIEISLIALKPNKDG